MSTNRIIIVMVEGRNAGGYVRRYYATEDMVTPVALVSAAGTFIQGRVAAVAVQHLMYRSGGARGDVAVSTGYLEITNADGALDAAIDIAYNGHAVSILEWFPATGTFSSHKALEGGVIEQATFTNDKVTFQLRDKNFTRDKNNGGSLYGGTNALPAGVDGTANDIKGQRKPTCDGICINITPVLVNTSKLIYQVDGQRGFATGWSLAVFDRRAALTPGSDYSSQSDMETTAPSAGEYRVWPAGGMFRIGASDPTQLLITCDVTNPVVTSSVPTASVCAVAGVTRDLLSANPDCGYYSAGEYNQLAKISEVVRSVGGFYRYGYVATFGGLDFYVSQLTDPADMPFTIYQQTLELDETNILEIDRVVPNDEERGIPVARVNVHYAKNYTVMSPTDLAGVAQADQAYYSREYRTVTASADPAETAKWATQPEIDVYTLLVDQADAQAEADRLIEMYEIRRDAFSVKVPGEVARNIAEAPSGSSIFRTDLQSVVQITYPRFGLEAGKLFRVLAVNEDVVQDTFTLTVWG
jgi:hypothetical protein